MRFDPKSFIIIAFLSIIFAEPLLQAAMEALDGERPFAAELFAEVPRQTFLRAFESELEDRSHVSQWTQPWMRGLQYLALNDLGERALEGRGAWLFYRPGVRYAIEPWPPRNGGLPPDMDVADAAADFKNQLAARGIELLVMPLPGKASVYPGRLAARAEDAGEAVYPHTSETMESLRAAGVEVLDVFGAFQEAAEAGGDLYLANDTHWTPAGAKLAAEMAAARLLELGWARRGGAGYAAKTVHIERAGDIPEMVRIPFLERVHPPETVLCEQVLAPDGSPRADDPRSELLVLGDSFLRIYELDEPGSAGFVSHLALELQAPVAAIVNDGGASTLVRQELARKRELLDNKRVVVWEFVERDIRFGTEGWRRVPLRLEPSSGSGALSSG